MAQAIKPDKKAVLLLSGGLDSSVSGIIALNKFKTIYAITFDYGQKAVKKEISASRLFCKRRGIEHKVIKLEWYKSIVKKLNIKIPNVKTNQLSGESAKRSAKLVWLPQRNLVFLATASAIAETIGASAIVTGFNAEEGRTFPDNTVKFINAMNNCFNNSSFHRVKIFSPVKGWNKEKILKYGIKNGLMIDEIWSCYRGKNTMCGKCESCQRLKRAISKL